MKRSVKEPLDRLKSGEHVSLRIPASARTRLSRTPQKTVRSIALQTLVGQSIYALKYTPPLSLPAPKFIIGFGPTTAAQT